MRLRPCIRSAEPWECEDEDELLEAFAEAAQQTADEAGSDLLESPEQWCRDLFRDHMIKDMRRELREEFDSYRAPDGVMYVLEPDQPTP